jgi:hypothetical protein
LKKKQLRIVYTDRTTGEEKRQIEIMMEDRPLEITIERGLYDSPYPEHFVFPENGNG